MSMTDHDHEADPPIAQEDEPLELKVGEVARRTGLTVRTLHHYHEIGLLEPSSSTAAGHRLYGTADLARLQRILSLRQLGFSLAEIGECLERPEFATERVVALHLARLDEQIVIQRRLRDRLDIISRPEPRPPGHARRRDDREAQPGAVAGGGARVSYALRH